jgi:hypothetical protein
MNALITADPDGGLALAAPVRAPGGSLIATIID